MDVVNSVATGSGIFTCNIDCIAAEAWRSQGSRQSNNLKVAGSNPAASPNLDDIHF